MFSARQPNRTTPAAASMWAFLGVLLPSYASSLPCPPLLPPSCTYTNQQRYQMAKLCPSLLRRLCLFANRLLYFMCKHVSTNDQNGAGFNKRVAADTDSDRHDRSTLQFRPFKLELFRVCALRTAAFRSNRSRRRNLKDGRRFLVGQEPKQLPLHLRTWPPEVNCSANAFDEMNEWAGGGGGGGGGGQILPRQSRAETRHPVAAVLLLEVRLNETISLQTCCKWCCTRHEYGDVFNRSRRCYLENIVGGRGLCWFCINQSASLWRAMMGKKR